jgi:hypothetical protein
MVVDKNKLTRVVEVSREFAHQWFLWKESLELDAGGMLPIIICNNFFDIALLQWAHLYGNFTDDLHYRNIVEDPDEFKAKLKIKLGITEEQWKANWDSLKDFRDHRIAHIDTNKSAIVPELNTAYQCISEYYRYARERLVNISPLCKVYDENLSQYIERNREYHESEIRKIYRAMSKI